VPINKKPEGALNLLHEADDDTVIWLESTATAALANQIINNPFKFTVAVKLGLQCFDAVGWVAGRASGL